MLPVIRICFLFFVATYSLATEVYNRHITWLMVDWPPYMHKQDHQTWAGYGTTFLNHIRRELDDYQHTFMETRYSTMLDLFKQERPVCSLGLFPTDDRLKYAYFSLPDQVFPPMMIWMRDETFQQWQQPKHFSLKKLLDSGKGVLGLKSGVAYSKEARELFEKHEPSQHIIRLDQSEMTTPLAEMLYRGRIDFMLEYSDMMSWISSKPGREHLKQLAGVRVFEFSNQVLFTRIACTRNEWGKDIVIRLNEILPRLYQEQSYWRPFKEYLLPTQLKELNQFIEKLIESPNAWKLNQLDLE